MRFVENQQYGLSAPKINHPYRTFSFAHHSHVRDAADHYLIIRECVKSSNAAPRTQTHALRSTTRCRVPCSRRECARFAVKYRALWPTHNMSIIWKHMQWPRARAHTRTKHQTLNTHTHSVGSCSCRRTAAIALLLIDRRVLRVAGLSKQNKTHQSLFSEQTHLAPTGSPVPVCVCMCVFLCVCARTRRSLVGARAAADAAARACKQLSGGSQCPICDVFVCCCVLQHQSHLFAIATYKTNATRECDPIVSLKYI